MRLKALVLFLVPAFSSMAYASKLGSIQSQLNGYRCKGKIELLNKKWQATKDWKGHIGEKGEILLKRPTQKFAHWIVLERSGKNEILTLMNPLNATRIEFDERCESKMASYNHKMYSNPKGLNDHALMQDLMANKKGIILMWSPGMGHSFTAIKRLQKISLETKLPITYVLDPFANEEVAKKQLLEKKISHVTIRKLSSLELFYRDATMHFPSLFMHKNGAIISNNIPGLMTEDSYRLAVKRYLGETK